MSYQDYENDNVFESADLPEDIEDEEIEQLLESGVDPLASPEDDDDIESVMDADEDNEDEEFTESEDFLLANEIVKSCEGRDAHGNPRAAFSLVLEKRNPLYDSCETLARQTVCAPALTVNRRFDFLEFVFDFDNARDANLRVMWSNIEKFGAVLNAMTDASVEIPYLDFLILPFDALGTCFMEAANPVFWSLQPARPGADCTQIHLLFRCEDIGFYQTDELDLAEVDAAAQRDLDRIAETKAKVEELEDERRTREQERNEMIEQQRARRWWGKKQ